MLRHGYANREEREEVENSIVFRKMVSQKMVPTEIRQLSIGKGG